MNTPLLLIVFNRPELTKQVFEKICNMKPSKLYIAGDGPREGFENENEKVKKVRKIFTNINWSCEVKTLFSDYNLGCKKACIKAIDWFFENEEKGIILEDDCLPHPDFFNFCENLLEIYNNDEKVSFISGTNFQNNNFRGDASYYFSKYVHIWGWATWKKSWKKYNVGNIEFWPKWCETSDFKDKLPDNVERKYWKNIFNKIYLNKIDTWDYPLTCSVLHKGGLTAIPNVNLIKNIGFGDDATHTKSKDNLNSNMKVGKIGNIIHPKIIQRNIEADLWTFNHHYGGKNIRFPYKFIFYLKKLFNYIKKIK